MIQEFREFIQRGNVVDLAVAFVMGVAFAAVVTAFVDRLLMPVIALIVGQPNFDVIGTFGDNGSIGAVITALVDFLLVAGALFLIVKAYNAFKGEQEEAEEEPTEEVKLLREIRDGIRSG